jgi:hypothetical protein
MGVVSHGDTMPHYRVYLIDKDDHIVSVKEMTAPSDADALEAAKTFVDGLDVEVWELGRKVGRLAA